MIRVTISPIISSSFEISQYTQLNAFCSWPRSHEVVDDSSSVILYFLHRVSVAHAPQLPLLLVEL